MELLKKEVELLIKKDYPNHFEDVKGRLEPSIGIKTIKYDESKGFSKFGGLPNLGENFSWPLFNNMSLSFMAQIDLNRINKFHKDFDFPNSGVLFFFMITDLNSEYPSLPGQFSILHEERIKEKSSPSKVIRSGMTIFKECSLEFYPHINFRRDFEYNDSLDEILDDLYIKICEITGHPFEGVNQIGGYPLSLQNPVYYLWSKKKNKSISVESLYEKSLDFRLLLQIDFSDPHTDFYQYGGNGMAYFAIDKEDLMNRSFKDSFLTCQN